MTRQINDTATTATTPVTVHNNANNTASTILKSSVKQQAAEVFQSLRIDTTTTPNAKAIPLLNVQQQQQEAIPRCDTFSQLVQAINQDSQPVFSPDGCHTPPKRSVFQSQPKLVTPRSATSPRPLCNSLFWFSNEESDHVQSILIEYYRALEIDKDRTPQSRQPKKFIGRVKRMCLSTPQPDDLSKGCSVEREIEDSPSQISPRTPLSKNMESPNSNFELRTFDEIGVYLRDLVPYASTIPFQTNIYCITSWSIDGLPRSINVIESQKDISRYITGCEEHCSSISYLFSLPSFSIVEPRYTYFSSHYDQHVTFSDPQSCFLGNSQCKKTKHFLNMKRSNGVHHIVCSPETSNDLDEDDNETTSDQSPTDHLNCLLSPHSSSPMFKGFDPDDFDTVLPSGEFEDDNDEDNYEQTSDDEEEEDSESEEEEDDEEGNSDEEEEESDEDSDDEGDESLNFRNKWRRRL